MENSKNRTESTESEPLRYLVKIHRNEEDGGLKTIDWDNRIMAIECANRWQKKGYAVQVYDRDEREYIYDEGGESAAL